MLIETEHVREIAEKASSLLERIGGMYIPAGIGTESDQVEIQAKLETWCQNAAKGNWERFAQRLQWDDLDIDTVHRLLGPVRIADQQPLPEWTHTLNKALKCSGSLSFWAAPEDRCLDKAAPIPFEELWLPFVHVARQEVIDRVNGTHQLLSNAAFGALERELLRTLSAIGSQSLHLEFMVFQGMCCPARLFDFMAQATAPVEQPSKDLYAEFVQQMLSGELPRFFHEYCMVGRLAATATNFWIETTVEFLTRLRSDLPTLQQLWGTDLGAVVEVNSGLSDPHHQGRAVLALQFAPNNTKLIYKPRDIGMETAFNQLLAWFNQQGISPVFKALRVLDRASYGWVEFVEHLPCQNVDEITLYYRRAGMLIGILYALHGADCHRENLIACGPHPVLIDVEMLLCPATINNGQDSDADSAQTLAIDQFRNSVLASGLLPIWNLDAAGKGFDISGLGGQDVNRTFQRSQWRYINTDQMTISKEEIPVPLSGAAVRLNGVIQSPNDYLDAIVSGFRDTYRFCLEYREAMLAPDGPLMLFRHRRARFLHRNTGLYAHLRQTAFDPDYMRDGAVHSIHLEMASWALALGDSKPRFWPVLREELLALEQMDIPLFSLYTDGCDLIAEDRIVVPEAFGENGYDLTIRTLNDLNEADMELQSSFIRASLSTRIIGDADREQPPQPALELDSICPLTTAQIIQEATRIAEMLSRSAIRSNKGITWISFEYNPELERHELKPLGHSLYSGLPGIALFFGALAWATGDTSYRHLALAALEDLTGYLARASSSRDKTPYGRHLGLGGALGIGAAVYVLARLGRLLNDEALIAHALQAAVLLSPQLIAEDRRFDVMFGAAGTILGLLALDDTLPDPRVLDSAVACGEHLLEACAVTESGHRAWLTLNNTALTGFSHGAAGIAYALARLYEHTSDRRFLDAAQEAFAYEHNLYSPAAGNWPDLRHSPSGTPIFMASWCHGAPGIALARLWSLSLLDSDQIRQDIDAAIETTRHVAIAGFGVDHLCCGTFGRVETLFTAGRVLSRPDLTALAAVLAARVVATARQRGSYFLFSGMSDETYSPGFFQGVSGIGYELLRLTYPDNLPSVLVWE